MLRYKKPKKMSNRICMNSPTRIENFWNRLWEVGALSAVARREQQNEQEDTLEPTMQVNVQSVK